MLKRFLIPAAVVATALAFVIPTLADESQSPDASRSIRPVVDTVCMQNAVEVRDTAVSTAVGTLSTSIQTALSVRKDALKVAWGAYSQSTPSERRAAFKIAWKNFTMSRNQAVRTFRTSRHDAWTKFRTSAKACHGQPEPQASEGNDTLQ